MTIHKEGYSSIALCILFIFILNAIVQYLLPDLNWLHWIIYILSFTLFFIILQFFRSPNIHVQKNESQIICPADGKVVVIEETDETEFLKDKRIQISVFMSPINVHVNRNPISGKVIFSKYHPGKFLVAWHPKSSTENERHSVVIKNGNTEILVKQIAGAVARRIVNYLEVGKKVKQTEEYGFIKFGSRVDLLLPIGTKINVGLNEVVQGGVTVIATL